MYNFMLFDTSLGLTDHVLEMFILLAQWNPGLLALVLISDATQPRAAKGPFLALSA